MTTRNPDLLEAFVDGAKWWEWKSRGATMWASDVNDALTEAERRSKKGDLPRMRLFVSPGSFLKKHRR